MEGAKEEKMLTKKSVTLEQSNMKVNTIIGTGAVFTGNVTVKDTIRIDGEVEGNVKTDATLIVGSSGKIKGNVEADTIFTGGCIYGNLTVQNKVEASPTAKIYGDIKTKVIVIDENAVFQGKCDMGQQKEE